MLPAKAQGERGDSLIAFRALAASAAAALALAAVGCDLNGDTTNDEPLASGDTDLSVTLDVDGSSGKEEPQTAEVSCDEDTTDDVCAAANDILAEDLDPVSPDTACTELFGGPDEATISGSLQGQDIDVTLTRANGCEIDRFDEAAPLLQALFEDYEPGGALEGPAPG